MKTIGSKYRLAALAASALIASLPSYTSGTVPVVEPALPRVEMAAPKPKNDNPGEGENRASFTDQLHKTSGLAQAGLDLKVLETALKGYERLSGKGMVSRDSILAIADFSKSSRDKRLFVIDLKNQRLVYHTLVAHGRNSGTEYANRFSNTPSSNMSSLGFYVTRGTYMGSNGYSLVLDGCEKGVNDKARERAIVIHAADYANEDVLSGQRYLGRSFGCPALPEKMNRKVIDRIKGGNVLFIYHPEAGYLEKSPLLKG